VSLAEDAQEIRNRSRVHFKGILLFRWHSFLQYAYENKTDPREIEWINETLAGAPGSFDHIVLKYQDQVYNLILKTIGNRVDAEDLAQNVFFNAFSSLKKFQKKSSLKTWLYSITFNQIRNYWRSSKYKMMYIESDELPLPEGEKMYVQKMIDAGPEEEVRSEEAARTVDRMISHLPPLQKKIFLLYYIFGHSCEEISEILDISPSNIKIQLFRGRKWLFNKFKNSIK
jgi:RNA polymerase sigma factor (sigma-70 family)